jgi:hypothetical protein
MLVRKVKAVIKNKYKGVGPSHATIHHYVANLRLIGMSPIKTGWWGTVQLLNYKALCAAFASYVRIQQLNSCEGTNK